MGRSPIRTALKIDHEKPAVEQLGLHNRWHPDIPSVGTINDGEVVKVRIWVAAAFKELSDSLNQFCFDRLNVWIGREDRSRTTTAQTT